MHFENIIECFKSIRGDASNRPRGSKTFDETSIELRDLILSTDEAHANESLVNLSKTFRATFCVIYWIMHRAWKQRVNDVRRSSATGKDRGELDIGDLKSSSSYHKITRDSCIPDYILQCKSNIAKAAVVAFCMQTTKGDLRKRALFYVLSGNCESMENAVALALSIPSKQIRALEQGEPGTHALKTLVRTFVDVSDLVRDRTLNKFAMFLNEAIYLDTITAMINNASVTETVTNLVPYDALIMKYLRECVAPKSYAKEHEQIVNQFKTDPRGTLSYMINNLPKNPVKRSTFNASAKAQPFEEDRMYEVFRGKHNYNQSIVLTNINHAGRSYHISTYNDCLYDVRGSTATIILPNGEAKHEYTLYNRLPWSERLALLPYRAKIVLSKMSGEQLNEYNDSATLTVSWIDDAGYECSKTHVVRARSSRNGETRKRQRTNAESASSKKSRNSGDGIDDKDYERDSA